MKYILISLCAILLLLAAADSNREVRPQVPVLCYHNIYTGQDKKSSTLAISREQFRAQIQALADSGYHTILPEQLHAYLTTGAPLPSRPVMITFDDTRAAHFSIAAPVLQEYGFKGVFFMMTVPIGKTGYMSAGQIQALADSGHVIGAHTWDHPHLEAAEGWDTVKQLIRPKHQLEKITGRPVRYFAYPFGEWNDAAIRQLRATGYKAAFQLAGRQRDQERLYTIRRMMVDGRWSGPRLQQQMQAVFK